MRKITKLFYTAFLLMAGLMGASAQDETFDLTADMFYTWNGYGADAVSTGAATVDFNIGTELNGGGVVAGTGGVFHLTYADLTGCSKMIFEGTAGVQLRVMMNRQESDNGPLTEKQPTISSNGIVELDLTDLPYVHLNAIKLQWGHTGVITAVKLVKPSDPLAIYKEQLKNALSTAKIQSSYGKTQASWGTLTTAITKGESALADAAATAESLGAATTAVNEAVSGLQLTVGYTKLTAAMFKKYASVTEPGEPQTAYPSFELNKASDLPYGDGNVSELNWADLTSWQKLIVTTASETKPRFCLNRLVAGGQQAETMEDSKMLDINPNNNYTWSTEKYLTSSDGIYTLDVAGIVADYQFARLHCIKKQGWGAGVVVTDMLLYKDMSYAIVGDLTGGWEDDVEMTATENEGEYTLTVENVVVGSTEAYKYKLRANGNWNDYQLPAGSDNALWTPEEGIGYYTLTFTANVLNHTLNCVGEKTADFEYAVVGCTYEGENEVQSELFAGSKAWDTNTTDIMTKQNDGTYVWEKEEIVLPAKWIDLKVVARDGENVIKWYGNNGQNVGLNINETGEGIYNVTVTFDGSNVTATAEKKRTFTVAGDNTTIFGTAYDANATANDMTLNDDGIYVKTYENVTLPICTIKYKVVEGRSSWIPDGIGNDLEIGIKMAGTYDITFSIDPTNKTISHVMSLHKSIGDAGYATYCSPYDLNFAETGVTAYIAKVDDSKIISFEPVTSAPANTGLLLKADKGTYKLKMETSTQNVDGNVFTGVNEETLVEKKGIYVLLNGNQGVGFYKTTANSFTVGANTAYIDAISGARSFIALDGEATAIEGIAAENVQNGEVYNLQGQRVMKAQKGLYIINGKKVVVK